MYYLDVDSLDISSKTNGLFEYIRLSGLDYIVISQLIVENILGNLPIKFSYSFMTLMNIDNKYEYLGNAGAYSSEVYTFILSDIRHEMIKLVNDRRYSSSIISISIPDKDNEEFSMITYKFGDISVMFGQGTNKSYIYLRGLIDGKVDIFVDNCYSKHYICETVYDIEMFLRDFRSNKIS